VSLGRSPCFRGKTSPRRQNLGDSDSLHDRTDKVEDNQSAKTLPLFGPSFRKNLPLGRRHEHGIFAFYSCLGTALLVLRKASFLSQRTVESTFSVLWVSMVLSISFLEAWVKFQAPFLRKHVAVDVGRHIFCALNTAELALSTCFSFVLATSMRPSMLLPAMALLSLWVEILVVAPKLYTRAKHNIVSQATKDLAVLNDLEKSALKELSNEVHGKPLPDPRWHLVYVGLEVVKLVSLATFVIWSASPPASAAVYRPATISAAASAWSIGV